MLQKNVLEWLTTSAHLFPSKTALIDEDGSMTFEELYLCSCRIGTALAEASSFRNRPIAVFAERRNIAVAIFMGVLMSGNFYLPIDPKTPPSRFYAILKQAKPWGIIYTEKMSRRMPKTPDCSMFCVEQLMRTRTNQGLLSERLSHILDIDPCYIIFTSGSTGMPKGIAVSHRSVINLIDWYTTTCGIKTDDIIGNQAPFYFDASVKNLYACLCRGCTMRILPQKAFSFPSQLIKIILEDQISVLSLVTAAFHLIAASGVLQNRSLGCVRLVILGGEMLSAKAVNLWRKMLPAAQYINLYGPTETTVDCTYYKIERQFADDEIIPIGHACENTEIMLLDENRKPVSPGEIGEICVRGTGVALGYYADFEKTEQSFIQNPENPWYPEKIYCTGDLGYKNEKGELVFVSRKDDQIKHMGYRIELGEVEASLLGCGGIKCAVCFFVKEVDKIICAYQGDATEEEIKGFMRERLPKYMLPGEYRQVERLPQNANGKIDRKRLKEDYLNYATKL